MPDVAFRTKRLDVRPWGPQVSDPDRRADLAIALAPMLSDEVLLHLPPALAVPAGEDGVDLWITARTLEGDVSLITDQNADALVGLLILAQPPHDTNLHIGYLFGRPHWGKGFATELLLGLVAWACANSPLTLIGGVGIENPASAHVLRKAGFTLDTAASSGDTQVFAFST